MGDLIIQLPTDRVVPTIAEKMCLDVLFLSPPLPKDSVGHPSTSHSFSHVSPVSYGTPQSTTASPRTPPHRKMQMVEWKPVVRERYFILVGLACYILYQQVVWKATYQWIHTKPPFVKLPLILSGFQALGFALCLFLLLQLPSFFQGVRTTCD